MHANERVIADLYDAFKRRDAKAMANCYAKNATFSDPVFPDLKGADINKMWTMLALGAKDLDISYSGLTADANAASVHWEARYTFSRTKRPVHNKIEARFELKNGKIVRHVDSFSFWRWSRQALGAIGWLLGWTPVVRNRVRRDAAARLAAFKLPAAKRA